MSDQWFGATVDQLKAALRPHLLIGLASDGPGPRLNAASGVPVADGSDPQATAIMETALEYGANRVRSLVLKDGLQSGTPDPNLAAYVIDYAGYYLHRRNGEPDDKNPFFGSVEQARRELKNRLEHRLQGGSDEGGVAAPLTIHTDEAGVDQDFTRATLRTRWW